MSAARPRSRSRRRSRSRSRTRHTRRKSRPRTYESKYRLGPSSEVTTRTNLPVDLQSLVFDYEPESFQQINCPTLTRQRADCVTPYRYVWAGKERSCATYCLDFVQNFFNRIPWIRVPVTLDETYRLSVYNALFRTEHLSEPLPITAFQLDPNGTFTQTVKVEVLSCRHEPQGHLSVDDQGHWVNLVTGDFRPYFRAIEGQPYSDLTIIRDVVECVNNPSDPINCLLTFTVSLTASTIPDVIRRSSVRFEIDRFAPLPPDDTLVIGQTGPSKWFIFKDSDTYDVDDDDIGIDTQSPVCLFLLAPSTETLYHYAAVQFTRYTFGPLGYIHHFQDINWEVDFTVSMGCTPNHNMLQTELQALLQQKPDSLLNASYQGSNVPPDLAALRRELDAL